MITARPDTEVPATTMCSDAAQFRWGPQINLANVVTELGLVCGMIAAGLAVAGHAPTAAMFIVGAVATDLVDGKVARATGSDLLPFKFGHTSEGMVDFASFGMATAAVLYFGQLRALPILGAVLTIMWVVAAHLRLTRYTVVGHDSSYMGCPAPLAAVLILAVALVGLPILTAACTFLLSVAMVSTFRRVPTWDTAGRALVRMVGRRGDAQQRC